MKTYYIYLTKKYAIEASIFLREGSNLIVELKGDSSQLQKSIDLMQATVDATLMALDDDRIGLSEKLTYEKDIN